MTLVRALCALVAALAATAAILGFSVNQSLSQPDRFVNAMDQAITQPAIQAEVAATIRQQVLATGDRLAADAGPLGGLARSGAEAVAGQVDATVASQRFTSAWTQWSRLLYSGLADFASGRPDPEVEVTGSTISVAIAPLVEPLLGETVAGGLTSALQMVGRDTDVSIATTLPVEQALTVMGAVSTWRWVLGAVAFALGAMAILGGPRRVRWAAVTLLLAALATGGAWWALQTTSGNPPPDSPTPQLAVAVAEALVAPWADQLKVASIALAVAGAVFAIVGIFVRRPTVGGNSRQP